MKLDFKKALIPLDHRQGRGLDRAIIDDLILLVLQLGEELCLGLGDFLVDLSLG